MKSLYKVWKAIKNARKNKENYIRKFNEGGKSFANIECAFNANILISNSGVLYNTKIISEYFFIPIEYIKKVGVITDEELTKQVIANKKHIIGELTFPRNTHLFLRINYIENNIELEKTVETKMAVFAVTSIIKARKKYSEIYPEPFIEEIDYTIEPKFLNFGIKDMDVPDQINKLFKLVEKGVLSQEEFNQKKKELLLRM
ncbi:SHOCT domain-containing protein [Clostridium estertheticum]|uniref:SHOCT domain-containing protein n=1 Tax=Clostridium estertheticum TaxID=238834 RepID=A0A7Y3SYB5_9CLOT|nr:SHOCT domain-containing protein [Clostridium estertheticum]NNU76867.1 SHOCT domain-containing protein [Clostridium estertheticum]WBL48738.1 SHOCT domain-containing protein [Clostridium estertheticum]